MKNYFFQTRSFWPDFPGACFGWLNLFALTCFVAVVFPHPAWGAPVGSGSSGLGLGNWETTIRRAIESAANGAFDLTFATTARFLAVEPDGCANNFFQAAAFQEYIQRRALMDDKDSLDQFEKTSERTIKFCHVEADSGSYAARFYLGAIYGYRSLLQARQRRMVGSVRAAIEARRELEKVRAVAPDLADNNFALGALYFYASVESLRAGGLRGWLARAFITHGKDLTDDGIALIESAIRADPLAGAWARATLAWAYLDTNQNAKVEPVATDLMKRYPGDPTSSWILARSLYRLGRYQLADENFKRVESVLRSMNLDIDGAYHDVLIARKLTAAAMAEERGDLALAARLNREVLDWLDRADLKVSLEYVRADQFLEEWRADARARAERLARLKRS